MTKYLFVFVLLASLATVACDTSSKASTTQTLAPAPPTQAAVVAAPIALDTVISPMEAKKGFKKKNENGDDASRPNDARRKA